MNRALWVVLSACLLASAACSADDDAATPSAVDLADVDLGEPAVFALEQSAVVPPGTDRVSWIEVLEDQICVSSVVDDEIVQTCATWDSTRSPIDADSLAWSPEGDTLYFTENFLFNFQEPDIWSLDVETGTLVAETDDGTDDPQADTALIDIAPMVTADGTPHFFTLSQNRQSVELNMLTTDGDPRSLPAVDLLQTAPRGPRYPLGQDRFLYRTFETDDRQLVLLDLGAGEASAFTLARFEMPLVLATGAGLALIGDTDAIFRFDEEASTVLVDVATGDRERLDFVSFERSTPAFAVSPDGRTVVAIFADPDAGSDDVQMVAVERSDTGELGEPFVVAEPGFLGVDDDDRPRAVRSTGFYPTLVWSRDNQLMVPTADEMLVFDLAPDSE